MALYRSRKVTPYSMKQKNPRLTQHITFKQLTNRPLPVLQP
jgi:hypothetical protein